MIKWEEIGNGSMHCIRMDQINLDKFPAKSAKSVKGLIPDSRETQY
jgi:hypothetical protein